jgi:hypothetical protein
VIRIRSRTWFMQRPREIPERLLQRWKQETTRQGALTLDTWLEIGALRDAQLQHLPELIYSAGLPHELHQVHSHRHLLRLYAILTAAQRQALGQGQPLSLAAMTPRQRELFAAALHELRGKPSEPPDPAQLAAAGLSLQQRPMLRVREQHDDLIHYREEFPSEPDPAPAPAPPAAADARNPPPIRHPVLVMDFAVHYGGVSYGAPITIALPP